MKTFSALAIGLFWVIGFTSSAEAITITIAEVQNGVAVVQGNKAEKSATVTWDGLSVTQTTKGGSFSFSGPVPADCVGTLSDGVSTIDVAGDGKRGTLLISWTNFPLAIKAGLFARD